MVGADFSALAARCPFLDTLCAEARARLAAGVREVSLRRGRVLFLEGDRPDAVYLVCSGLVRIFVTELDGSDASSWHNLGTLLVEKKLWNEHASALERAVQMRQQAEKAYQVAATKAKRAEARVLKAKVNLK